MKRRAIHKNVFRNYFVALLKFESLTSPRDLPIQCRTSTVIQFLEQSLEQRVEISNV